jgi:hypothetical protein
MTRQDILKFRYQRSNETENKVLVGLIDKHPDIIIFDQFNTESIIKQRINNNKGNVLLFLDALTPNLTAKGNHKKIEFLLIDNKGNYTWIDAKHANTTTNVTDLQGEYDRAQKCKGNVHFIVDGEGYCDAVINEHKQYIKKAKLTTVNVMKLAEYF